MSGSSIQSPWTIAHGYVLQFAHSLPKFGGIVHSVVPKKRADILPWEITELLSKQAIIVVPLATWAWGFCSRYFVGPKRDAGMRPILDLRHLNGHLRCLPFHMLTL